MTDVDLRASRDLYRANLGWGSAGVERMLRLLLAAGLLDETVVAVVGDHGEAFGEHGNIEHGETVFAEEIEVPWVMMFPAAADLVPCRAQGPASLIDVKPTLLSLLSIDAGDTDGIDLTDRLLIEGDAHLADRPLFSRSYQGPRYVVRYRGFSYHNDLYTRAERLYHTEVDPRETRPLPVLDSPRAARMRAILCRHLCEALEGDRPRAGGGRPRSPQRGGPDGLHPRVAGVGTRRRVSATSTVATTIGQSGSRSASPRNDTTGVACL